MIPVGFDYRSKIEDPRWRNFWDRGGFAGSAIPSFLFGVAIGNLLLGVPFYFDEFMRPFVAGTLLGLLHPFTLLSGVLSLTLLVLHGAVYAPLRTDLDDVGGHYFYADDYCLYTVVLSCDVGTYD